MEREQRVTAGRKFCAFATTAAFLAPFACSSSSTPRPGAIDVDGGAIPPDATPSADSPFFASDPPRAVLVHAAPGAPALRFCFAIASGGSLAMSGQSPLPDATEAGDSYPGLFPGRLWSIPYLTDLPALPITIFAIRASSIAHETSDAGASEATCIDLLGSDGKGTGASSSKKLAAGTDYVALEGFGGSAVAPGGSYVAILSGCWSGFVPPTSGVDASAVCGADDAGAPLPLGVSVASLDPSATPPAGAIDLQFVQASRAIEGLVAPHGVIATVRDGGSITQAPARAGDPPSAPAPVNADPSAPIDVSAIEDDGGARPILTTSLGELDASAIGATYALVLVGDPEPAVPQLHDDGGAPFDGRGLHVVAVRASPP